MLRELVTDHAFPYTKVVTLAIAVAELHIHRRFSLQKVEQWCICRNLHVDCSPQVTGRDFRLELHVLGAPPMVASGSLSMVYLWLCRYITGTPGICTCNMPCMKSCRVFGMNRSNHIPCVVVASDLCHTWPQCSTYVELHVHIYSHLHMFPCVCKAVS